jgi:hypothetical protein
MRRVVLLLAVFGFTALATSAVAQDSTRRDTTWRDSTQQDTTRQDTTRHRPHKRVHMTSPGEVDTAKIRAPSRRDSSLVRHEMRRDTASAGSDTAAKPAKPPADSQPPRKPSSPH